MRLLTALAAAMLWAVVVIGATPLLAESTGWVSGLALDAGGRPLASRRVELLGASQGQPVGVPVQAGVTDAAGAWSFSAVPAGEYVVQVVDRGRTVGVPVAVTEAAGLPGVLIVAPSLPPPVRFSQGEGGPASAGSGGFKGLAVASGIVAAAAATSAVLVVRDES